MSQKQKVFPSDGASVLLLSDDVRQEVGGKLTLIGYMPGHILKLEPKPADSNAQEALQSLVILMIFQDGVGTFNLQVSLTAPDGDEILKGNKPQSVEKLPDGAMNVNLVMKPFPAKAGTYNLTVSLDDRDYKRSFSMIRD